MSICKIRGLLEGDAFGRHPWNQGIMLKTTLGWGYNAEIMQTKLTLPPHPQLARTY